MDGSSAEAAAGTLGQPAEQHSPGTVAAAAPPSTGRQQEEESSGSSSSSSGSSSSSESDDEEERPPKPVTDPLSYLNLGLPDARQKEEAEERELLGRRAGPVPPPALSGPAWERPSPEEYELILYQR